MTQRMLHFVQPFEKSGDALVPQRASRHETADEAILIAMRRRSRCAGIVALTQVFDPRTGEMHGEPLILAVHGEVPFEIAEE